MAGVSGDLDMDKRVTQALQELARRLGISIYVTSGGRTKAEQAGLYANRGSNPFPVAVPGTSRHETLLAADATIDGQPIANVVSAEDLKAVGLHAPVPGDPVHLELLDGGGGGVAKGALDAVGDAAGAVGDVVGDAKDKVGGAVGDAVIAAFKLMFGAVGDEGAKILLYVAFVVGGAAATGLGIARMTGLRGPAGAQA